MCLLTAVIDEYTFELTCLTLERAHVALSRKLQVPVRTIVQGIRLTLHNRHRLSQRLNALPVIWCYQQHVAYWTDCMPLLQGT
eukprot:4578274-Amphidinium_carterae.1